MPAQPRIPDPAPGIPPAAIAPGPVSSLEPFTVRTTLWESDPVLHPELLSDIRLELTSPGHYPPDDAVSLSFVVAGGPRGRGERDQGRVDVFWWELDTFAAAVQALVERARQDGTIPTRHGPTFHVTRQGERYELTPTGRTELADAAARDAAPSR